MKREALTAAKDDVKSGQFPKDINQLNSEDRAAHDWYRFVLSFPPHLVRTYLERFGVKNNSIVLDPFAGTGTTLVECKKLGITSVGIEANTMAQFASQTKVSWRPEPQGLLRHAQLIAEKAEAELALIPGDGLQRQFSEENYKVLLKNSISAKPLHKSLVLLDWIERCKAVPYYDHERLALAKAVVFSASNLRFAPEVSVVRQRQDAPVIAHWLAEIRAIANDLSHLASNRDVPTTVHHADARHLLRVLPPNSIDVVITSPPYPNEKDYTRTTRLESVLLGFIQNKRDLQTVKRGLIRSNSRNIYSRDDDDQWVSDHPEVNQIADTIEARRIELGKTSGFERRYAQATRHYFGGMAKHLMDLRKILSPGAQLAYVVGDQASYLRVLIRTGASISRHRPNIRVRSR